MSDANKNFPLNVLKLQLYVDPKVLVNDIAKVLTNVTLLVHVDGGTYNIHLSAIPLVGFGVNPLPAKETKEGQSEESGKKPNKDFVPLPTFKSRGET